ncbi:hypothetical protein PENSPDRAFT_272408 [Peniophora sp. CONT]|nr:hypothetical protein PENSPDRAFT_272408 [Peniophora sp. CONT]
MLQTSLFAAKNIVRRLWHPECNPPITALPATANMSSNAPVIILPPEPFSASSTAVVTNAPWFSALLITLVCVLLSTLIQEWSRNDVNGSTVLHESLRAHATNNVFSTILRKVQARIETDTTYVERIYSCTFGGSVLADSQIFCLSTSDCQDWHLTMSMNLPDDPAGTGSDNKIVLVNNTRVSEWEGPGCPSFVERLQYIEAQLRYALPSLLRRRCCTPVRRAPLSACHLPVSTECQLSSCASTMDLTS